MLLPTGFFGVDVLVVGVLVLGVLEESFEVVLMSCVLGRVGVFVSAALLVEGFLAVVSDFGVSGFALTAEEGRLLGVATGFLDAGVVGLVTSGWERTYQEKK